MHPQHSENEDSQYGESAFRSPHIALLNEEHWFYIRRWYRMSARELQVAELVCKGFSNEEIAKDLNIKRGTVKTHIRNIYRRIHVKNKIEMLLKFMAAAARFSAKWGTTFPVPIIDIKELDKKASALSNIPQKR